MRGERGEAREGGEENKGREQRRMGSKEERGTSGRAAEVQ